MYENKKHTNRNKMNSIGISADNLSVTYRNGHTVLWNSSFEIPRGTITALVGVNGAGKSTLFKAIMGFVPVAKGCIKILGLDVNVYGCSPHPTRNQRLMDEYAGMRV